MNSPYFICIVLIVFFLFAFVLCYIMFTASCILKKRRLTITKQTQQPEKPRMEKVSRCECLDFVEASHRHRVYPVMYCHMEISGHLDINRLKTAIQSTCRYVPEILYTYDFKRGHFVNIGLSVDDTIIWGNDLYLWDLSSKAQLQISICRQKTKDIIAFGMSHILTDANGFLQYLCLLAALYNGQPFDLSPYNNRKIAPILKNIHVHKPTQQTRKGRRKEVPPLRTLNTDKNFFCLVNRISYDDFSLLHAKAKKNRVTLNCVFMTAYIRVISRLKNVDTVIVSCPADLRRFSNAKNKLTVANMTGIYQRVTIEMKPHHTFIDTLLQVYIEMELQKSRYRCFAGIKALNYAFHKVPRPLLEQIIKYTYRLLPVSYTNIGRIDDRKLSFNDCHVKSCYMTGAYRLSPDFQLSISTFQDICTLNCMLIGNPEEKIIGQNILEQVKQELLGWLKDKEI